MSITITATARTYPSLPYEAMKNHILGASYELSLVFVGAKRAAALNEQTRGKTYVPNVLSFPLDDTAGEIYITPQVATHEAAAFNLSPNGYIAYLFIHGCLHLTGLDHGPTMDAKEAALLKRFAIT